MRRQLLAVCFLAAFTLTAQQTPRVGETVEVSIVNVDVVVTDRKGNRVRGLTKDDFQVLENGRLQAVSNFAEYAADDPDARVGVAGSAEAGREKRTFLIFFEKMQLTGFGADAITEALKKAVAEVVRPGDTVSVVYWSRYEIEHFDVGDDPVKIASAIDFLNRKAKTIRLDEREQFMQDERERGELLRDAPFASEPDSEVGRLTGSHLTSNFYLQRAYGEMTLRVAAINAAINSIAGIDGRKVFFLATHRLGEVAGGEFVFAAGADTVPSHLRSMYGTGRLLQSITDNANAAGVTIYPVFPAGLEGSAGSDYQTLINEKVTLQKIAEKTGGISAAGSQDVVELLPRLASDVGNYYSLAYRVGSDGTDRARDIAVKTRNPEYVVRARTQFVEKSDDTRMRDRLKAALFRSNPESQIGISVQAGKAKRSRGAYTVPVEVKIPIRQLTMLRRDDVRKHAGRFSVYIGVATELNELSDVTQKTQPFEVTAAQLKRALGSHFTYEMDVEVTGKSKYLAVGVFDEVGRTYGLQRIELEQKK
ncbi:MAG TPA: VWA domain-containing protein [Thermoanaerobaculia bacterium]|nr:VWA domain-containing protein [Thermoanaerobaculia bacterium]